MSQNILLITCYTLSTYSIVNNLRHSTGSTKVFHEKLVQFINSNLLENINQGKLCVSCCQERCEQIIELVLFTSSK